MRRPLFRVMLMPVLLLGAAGCSSGGTTTELPQDAVVDVGPELTQTELLFPDVKPPPDGKADETLVPVDVADDGLAEVGRDFGDFGKPCNSNTDCESGFCLQMDDEESVCTISCVEECPKDWLCKGIETPPDWTFICVPPSGNLCKECESDEDCAYKGDLCLAVGTTGSYCVFDCSESQKCPAHYTCQQVVGDNGLVLGEQCMPDTDSCVCTYDANGTVQDCSNENDFGKCFGEQLCDGPDGWTECDAKVPAEEICDGQDNNCDGDVDEGFEPEPCANENEFGSCEGTASCKGAEGYVCEAAVPAEDLCDGLDNNCTGEADEEFPDTDSDGEADCVDVDDDADGILDEADNCPLVANPGQEDTDKDDIGDACEGDKDGDGILDDEDNCPDLANGGQEDLDGDNIGDVCDDDKDGDGIVNTQDNCPDIANDGQVNSDNDALGDLCDTDDDNDEVPDEADNCPKKANQDQSDIDEDGLGDVCDDDADGDGEPNLTDCGPYNADVYPGAEEGCNGLDDNCNTQVDEGYPDTDSDQQADCVDDNDDGDPDPDATDCAPLDPDIFNGAEEVCDGVDNNCNGKGDEGCPAVAVRLRSVQAVSFGVSKDVQFRASVGKPAAGRVTSQGAGYVLRWGK